MSDIGTNGPELAGCVEATPEVFVRRNEALKRGFDLVFAALLLPAVLPVIAILWLLIRLDGGPGFYGHSRVGRNGRSFRCWKIRTMTVHSEAVLKRHLERDPKAREEWEQTYKLEHDPRITSLGRFLRRSSLDELPQIWNILKGEMSFVGPRPVVEDELSRYGPYKWAYLGSKPGLTGLWQVSGRNTIGYDERVALDMHYLRTATIVQDVVIVFRTAGVVLLGTGR